MIVVLKENPNPEQLNNFISWLKEKNIQVQETVGAHTTILGLIGDTTTLDIDLIHALDIVDDVKRVQEPYKKANRKVHPEDTVIKVGNTQIGGGTLTLMAGPCSVETEDQIVEVAKAVKAAGATVLRGGAFKPRTSPYAFQGLGGDGLELLKLARKETGLPIVTEIMDASQLPLFDDIDIIQVGTRNMQNFNLLKILGQQDKPVMLKRGMSSTYEEWLMSAEYIMAGGNPNVILCERGIRTYEKYTRNTLPIVIDPSHAMGKSALVPTMATAAVAAGCDGLIIEVHNDPEHAWCDGPQSLRPEVFADLSKNLHSLHSFMKQQEA